MKIRTDFVTNSSSSSFILGFKDKNSIVKTIEYLEQRDNGNHVYYNKLLIDVLKAKGSTAKEKVIKSCLHEIEDIAKNYYFDYGCEILIQNDTRACIAGDCSSIDAQVSAKYKELAKKVSKYNYFVEVSYSDDYPEGAYMEQVFVPSLPICLMSFNHH